MGKIDFATKPETSIKKRTYIYTPENASRLCNKLIILLSKKRSNTEKNNRYVGFEELLYGWTR